MDNLAIRVENLSKKYHIGTRHADSMREQITYSISRMFRRNGAGEAADILWALKDINFEVQHGEVLGIIGHNGAGKSTLLKILSRITHPTTGRVEIAGRVASLLEVGTGFHPEMTGRENIYMNAAILGMKRAEIRKKFDEIVAFAEVEKFIDTPVKRYSSGMYTRLAFSVAAHLDPEILIVDEVLSVGDAAFQKRSIGKMNEVSRQGRTALFVSHNLLAVASICDRCIWLDEGGIVGNGSAAQVTAAYQSAYHRSNMDGSNLQDADREGNGKATFQWVEVSGSDANHNDLSVIVPGSTLHIRVGILCHSPIYAANVAVTIYDLRGLRIVDVNTALKGDYLTMNPGEAAEVQFSLYNLLLRPDTYIIGIWMGRRSVETIDWVEAATSVTIQKDLQTAKSPEEFPGVYLCEFTYRIVDRADPS
jgi:lipopolysaccharide transport system ATP-binding protein